MEALTKIQEWYFNNCDGDWEHQRGIRISTIDNPGWRIEINLTGTKHEDVPFEKNEIERSENDWLQCWVKDKIFNAACGPLNLKETLIIFLQWVSK